VLTTLPPSVSRLSRQCEILNISQPYRLPKSVTGIALLFFLLIYVIGYVLTVILRRFPQNPKRAKKERNRMQFYINVIGFREK
jgi:hypothetical protein